MSARRSRFLRALLLLLAAVWPARARAQACCAGTGAVTPGRLGQMDFALVGIGAKGGVVAGSFDSGGHFVSPPAGAGEVDVEQDLFGAVRVVERGQVAVLVPLVETWRQSLGKSEAGGGIGDVNANVRYDFVLAGASRVVPGMAALAGVTFPTGTPADASGLGPLATGATGIGAYQISFGIALEQSFGSWLVNATGIVAARTTRSVGSGTSAVSEQLGAQWTALSAVAYTFANEAAIALSASEALEGDATVNGADQPGTGRRLLTVALSGLLPLGGGYRLQGSVTDNPPIPWLGLNQTADVGLTIAGIRTWY